jgi:hypothetical protein
MNLVCHMSIAKLGLVYLKMCCCHCGLVVAVLSFCVGFVFDVSLLLFCRCRFVVVVSSLLLRRCWYVVVVSLLLWFIVDLSSCLSSC